MTKENYSVILDFLNKLHVERGDIEEQKTFAPFLKLALEAIHEGINECNKDAFLSSEGMRNALDSQQVAELVFKDDLSSLQAYRKMIAHNVL